MDDTHGLLNKCLQFFGPMKEMNRLAGKTPLDLGNANLYSRTNTAAPFTTFYETCEKHGDKYLLPKAGALNTSRFPTDYSDSAEECLGKPGTHVWIVFADGAFAAARAITSFEILSKHQDLYLRSGSKPVVAAGEVLVNQDHSVVFNFLSGTFMEPVARTFNKKYGVEYVEFYEPWMRQFWMDHGASSATYDAGGTFIKSSLIPFSENALRNYTQGGVEFRVFPTEEACVRYAKYSTGEGARQSAQGVYERTRQSILRMNPAATFPAFRNWLGEKRYTELFVEPANTGVVLRGGRQTRRKRKNRTRRFK